MSTIPYYNSLRKVKIPFSFEEIITHHDVFVGSEATDYGEHLHNLHKFEDEL